MSVASDLKRLLEQHPELKQQIGDWVEDFLLEQVVERAIPFCPSLYGRLFYPLVYFLLNRSRASIMEAQAKNSEGR